MFNRGLRHERLPSMLLNVTQSLLLYTEVLTKRFLVQGQRWYMYSLRVLSVRRVLILKHGASVSHARPNKSKACAVCTAPLLWVQWYGLMAALVALHCHFSASASS